MFVLCSLQPLAAESGQSLSRVDSTIRIANSYPGLKPHWLVFSEASFDFQFKVNENFTVV